MRYVLLIKLNRNKNIKVGKIGKIKFLRGYYLYVGSAKNLKRIERHFYKNKKLKWHIDYLTTKKYVNVLQAYISNKEESELAKFLGKYFKSIKKFGASDDKICNSHLFIYDIK